jgi:hypothetical protein
MTTSSTRFAAFSLFSALTIFITACVTPPSNEGDIATSVALTVQAQDTERAAAQAVQSATPMASFTPFATATGLTAATATTRPTARPAAGGEGSCMSASLVGETVPDGTVVTPGQKFTKVWKIKNTSTCVWDTSYKIVFWDGEVMGGGYVYNFPQQALPGDTVDVPLVLTAPTAEGTFQSLWKLQTPGGASFGVGYDTPFWVEVVVSSDTDYEYGITEVTYNIVREPETGCPANVFYHFSANVTVNGPMTITYNFNKSDGTSENKRSLKFTQAGTQTTTSWTWSIHLGSSTNDRWIQLFTVSPTEQSFGKAYIYYDCQ